ncbi:MAG: radical SAM protein [Promethearchaeota archaeon]|nr:MAG: radical SAM protein [Candidatus Lokiarchaeota archaeon]
MEYYNPQLLFIHPTFFYQEPYHKDLFYRDFPLKALELSAILKKNKKIKTHFLDLRFEKDLTKFFSKAKFNDQQFEKAFIKVLEKESIQDLQNVGIISTSSFEFLQIEKISKIIKNNFPKINIIVAGHHPSAVPNNFIEKSKNYDIIIEGKPEIAFLNLFTTSLLNKVKKRKKPFLIKPKDVFNLNDVPLPDYDTYLQKYKDKTELIFTISASEGCPFHCRFCKIPRTKFRNYSFVNFLERFENLQNLIMRWNYQNPKIGFLDQSFNSALLSNKILKYIIERKLQDQYRFSCQTRIEIVSNHKNLLSLFKKAKMVVGYGFESANKGILYEMRKTSNPTAYIKKMKEILEFYENISEPYCRLNIIAGFPGENNETFLDTIEFLETYALHPNVQINPTIYINDPNTYVYKNMDYYHKTFQSMFLKEWWKIDSDPLKNSIPLKSSKNYHRSQLVKDYVERYRNILVKFKYSSIPSLINWKKYFGNWSKNLT